MDKYQTITQTYGLNLIVRRSTRIELHKFDTEEEATARLKIIEEAFSWIGTPFVDCGDVKGPNGAVDCAMLLRRCYVDTGRLAEFDPRPYPPRWHIHRNEELFIGWIEKLGGIEVAEPKIGDVIVYQFGRCFAHGAILVNSQEIVHSFSGADRCLLSRRDESILTHKSTANKDVPRPVKYFNMWGK
jgi:hypothetical protein